MRHRDRVEALDALMATANDILIDLRNAARDLIDSAAYHRAAADELRAEAERRTKEESAE